MSIPPQLIRVKRKRVDESPVTFLQFDEGVKRHRSGSHWAYQRRDPVAPQQPPSVVSARDPEPVIHVSKPTDAPAPPSKRDEPRTAAAPPAVAAARDPSPRRQRGRAGPSAEPRRFHMSRNMLAPPTSQPSTTGISKRGRSGPTIFVERTRKKIAAQLAQRQQPAPVPQQVGGNEQRIEAASEAAERPAESRPLKKPGTTTRTGTANKDLPSVAPLPPSLVNRHNEDMNKIASDMNDWVLNEIGANLQSIEQEKQEEKQRAERMRFRPKAPAQRYQERQPQPVPAPAPPKYPEADTAMTDVSDDEGDEADWIIDEYVRIPATSVALDAAPADVGVLVLDGEEESTLFFGPEHDDDEMDDDEEDENAENYYTADYPEDEVESDDEYGRHPYGYRNGLASDDEEFDNDDYDDEDSEEMVIERGADDDTNMARIRAFNMKHKAAAAFP